MAGELVLILLITPMGKAGAVVSRHSGLGMYILGCLSSESGWFLLLEPENDMVCHCVWALQVPQRPNTLLEGWAPGSTVLPTCQICIPAGRR